MPVAYPSELRGMINAGKTRNIAPSFAESRPLVGASYIESVTDDAPFLYSFQLTFTRPQAAIFWAWFNSASYCDKGRAQFTMPIRIDSGEIVDQTVRFTADGIPQLTSDLGGAVVYSCTVYGARLEVATPFDTIMEFYEIYGADTNELIYLDKTVNEGLPNA